MDCRVGHLGSLLAMTKNTPPMPLLSSRGLKARGDPLALTNRTVPLTPRNDKEEGTHGPFQEENRIPFK